VTFSDSALNIQMTQFVTFACSVHTWATS